MLFNNKDRRDEEGNCEYTLYHRKISKIPDSMPDSFTHMRDVQRLFGNKRISVNNLDFPDPETKTTIEYYLRKQDLEVGCYLDNEKLLQECKIDEDIIIIENEIEGYKELINEYGKGVEHEE